MTGVNSEDRDQNTLQARLLWFRSDHPDAEIETELVGAKDDIAVCRATLRTQTGGSASSHGSALRDSTGAGYVELAEDRALTRALIALGYGDVQPESSVDDDDEPATALPPIELMSARSLVREEPETAETEYEEPQTRPQQIREERPARETASDDGADVNWTKFWTWARRRGYRDANQLSELLSIDVLARTPREVRQMLTQYELDHPPGGESE
jgi:hypothetical protein